MKIKIIDLGRENFNGEFTFEGTKEQIDEQILKECKKHLMSDEVSIENNTIYAGFHAVGKIEVLKC